MNSEDINNNINSKTNPFNKKNNSILKSNNLDANNNYEGIGSAWNVTHWANRTDKELEVSFSNNSNDIVSIPLGEGWEGYKLYGSVYNLYDERNWNNGTFTYGNDDNSYGFNENDSLDIANKFQNWTFHWSEGLTYDNNFSGNYFDSAAAGSGGHDCLELRMKADDVTYSGWYGYEQGDICWWSSYFKVPRGNIIDSILKFDVNPNYLADFNSWEFAISINNIKVYAIGTYSLKQYGAGSWHSFSIPMGIWINSSNVFSGILNNSNVQIKISLEYIASTARYGGFSNIEYQQIFIDNVQLLIKSEVKPSQIKLKMNNLNVNDVDWGKGYVTELNTFTTSPVQANFSSNENWGLSNINFELKTNLTVFSRKDTPETNYETNTGSIGTKFLVSNNTLVYWECYTYISVPTGYEETEMRIEFPSDINITWISNSQQPNNNILNQCDNSTMGILIIPVNTISNTPDGFWKLKGKSQNYCNNINIYNNKTGAWILNNTFLSGDFINITAKILNSSLIKDIITQTKALLRIRLPDGTIWTKKNQLKSLESDGMVYFDPFEIPAAPPDYQVGEYKAIITWNNSHSSFNLNETGIILKKFIVIHDSNLSPDQNQYFYDNVIEDSTINLKVSFTDKVDGSAIENALVYTFNFTHPSKYLKLSEISPGFYFIELNVSGANAGNNTITIYANSTLYINQKINITIEVIKETKISAAEYPIIQVPWNNNFTIHLNYTELKSGNGITATITHNWVGAYSIKMGNPGMYNLTFNSSLYQVNQLHSLIINTEATGYEAQSILIKVEILERGTYIHNIFMNSVNHTDDKEITLTSGENLTISVQYLDSATNNFIKNANVKLIGGGIDKSFTQNIASNNYSIMINTTILKVGVTFLTISAQKQNYSYTSEVLTININERGTYYELYLNSINKTNDRYIKLTVNKTLNITIKYNDLLTKSHISGANVNLSGSGLTEQLAEINKQYITFINTSDLNQGVNFLTVYAKKDGYLPQSILITVEIIERETNLTLFINGSDETLDPFEYVIIGSKINITIQYKDATNGAHITAASIRLLGEGMNETLTENYSLKQYTIIINSTDLNWGVNFLTVQAIKNNYEPQSITIRIEIISKETYLEVYLNNKNKTGISDKSIELSWNTFLNITIKYKDNSTHLNIPGATVKVSGEGTDNLLALINNQYTILINTTDLGLGTKYLTISANKTNYDSQSVSITVKVVVRTAKINDIFLNNKGNITFLEIPWNETLNITITYLDVLSGKHISSANVKITGTGISANLTEIILNEQYTLIINTRDLSVGIKYLTIYAEKLGYEAKSVQITLKIKERDTKLEIILNNEIKTQDPTVELPIGKKLDIIIRYIDNLTSQSIPKAIISISGLNINEQLTFDIIHNYYYISIDSNDLDFGNKFLTILANKDNYTEISEIITVRVRVRDSEIKTESGKTTFNIKPGEDLTIKIILNDLDFNFSIKNALVKYTWELGQGTIEYDDNDGVYELTIENIPEGSYTLIITVVAGVNYEFERYEIIINAIRPKEETLLIQIGLIAAIIVAIGLTGYLIAYQKVLKYPKPIRKVRTFKKKFDKKKFEKYEIISKEQAIKALYTQKLGSIAKGLKNIQKEITMKEKDNLKDQIKDNDTLKENDEKIENEQN
ncbi:MAG: hypothetical protein ACTSRP_14995 [Candidatus Helarchaeota archaeon]